MQRIRCITGEVCRPGPLFLQCARSTSSYHRLFVFRFAASFLDSSVPSFCPYQEQVNVILIQDTLGFNGQTDLQMYVFSLRSTPCSCPVLVGHLHRIQGVEGCITKGMLAVICIIDRGRLCLFNCYSIVIITQYFVTILCRGFPYHLLVRRMRSEVVDHLFVEGTCQFDLLTPAS